MENNILPTKWVCSGRGPASQVACDFTTDSDSAAATHFERFNHDMELSALDHPVCSITPAGDVDESLRNGACMVRAVAQMVDRYLNVIGHVCREHLYAAPQYERVLLPGVDVAQIRNV